jgi:hypothetical protein
MRSRPLKRVIMSLATESGEKLRPRILSRKYFGCNRVAEAGDGPIIIWLFGKDSR